MNNSIAGRFAILLARARNLNWAAFHDPIVSPDLKTMIEGWGGEFALDDEFINALRLASWKRRWASNYSDDLSRTAVVRVAAQSVSAAIPMKARAR